MEGYVKDKAQSWKVTPLLRLYCWKRQLQLCEI